jgi:hypothetical protein
VLGLVLAVLVRELSMPGVLVRSGR